MPAFTPEAIQQIRKAVKRVLAEEVGTRSVVPRGPRRLANWIGKVTVEVTARSGATPGTGTIKLQTAPIGGALADHAGTVSATMTVTVFSLLTTAVAVDSFVIVTQDQLTGRYWLNSSDAMPSSCYIGKLASALATNTKGTVTLWEQTSTGAAWTVISPTETVDAFNFTGQTLQPGAFVKVFPVTHAVDLVVEPYLLEVCP